MPSPSSRKPDKSPKVFLWVEWGYEIHRLKVDADDWDKITAGKKVILEGERYSYDGDRFDCTWHFNSGKKGSLTVGYIKANGDWMSAGDGYCGTWNEAYENGLRSS